MCFTSLHKAIFSTLITYWAWQVISVSNHSWEVGHAHSCDTAPLDQSHMGHTLQVSAQFLFFKFSTVAYRSLQLFISLVLVSLPFFYSSLCVSQVLPPVLLRVPIFRFQLLYLLYVHSWLGSQSADPSCNFPICFSRTCTHSCMHQNDSALIWAKVRF